RLELATVQEDDGDHARSGRRAGAGVRRGLPGVLPPVAGAAVVRRHRSRGRAAAPRRVAAPPRRWPTPCTCIRRFLDGTNRPLNAAQLTPPDRPLGRTP